MAKSKAASSTEPRVSTTEIVIDVRLVGLRPLMFDRYAGDNKTVLPVTEKVYTDEQGYLIIPALNIHSLLCAENTKSVCRQFFGKDGKNIGLGISSYVTIEPFEIQLKDDNGPIHFTGFNEQIYEHRSVARLKAGVPNPKQRPCLRLPWSLDFTLTWLDNDLVSLENLKRAFIRGGTLGLGTFRPMFGRYRIARFEERK